MAGIDERIEESKNWFERITQHIPGYKGYKQKEIRREADKIQRVYVAEKLAPCLSKLDDVKLDLIRAGNLDALGEIDVTMRKLRTVRDRVQFADYGYAGLFDATKVGTQKLDELYAFDKGLETEAGAIGDLAGALAADSPSLKGDIRLLDDRIEALDAHFAERENLITGAGR
ncbi:MAG: hypothetical protein A2133_10685 [Actinobacteria bacterium RBG_16_64_13]|nr:MAG: hypothetical protein A2133_10685 [Actinobacteria bacterium RBG_16_64_13]